MLELVSKVDSARAESNSEYASLQKLSRDLSVENKGLLLKFKVLEGSVGKMGAMSTTNPETALARLDLQIAQLKEAEALGIEHVRILTDQLRSSKQAYGKSVAESSIAKKGQEELEQLSEKLKGLESRLALLESGRPIMFRNSIVAGKSIVMIDVMPNSIEMIDLARGVKTTFPLDVQLLLFRDGLQNFDTPKTHFILFVRPGAAAGFDRIVNELKAVNASYGYDLLGTEGKLMMRDDFTR